MSPLPWVYDSAVVVVKSGDWTHSFSFTDTINQIIIRGDQSKYQFVVYTSDFEPKEFVFPLEAVENTSMSNPLYLDITYPNTFTLEIQPGPEEGKDATITDLNPLENFGMSPFWEAGYMSEPVLAVMRTTKSLIDFTLSY